MKTTPIQSKRRSWHNIPLLLITSAGAFVGAFYACRYVALLFFYFVCQPALLEKYVTANPLFVNPANEGRLVCVHGALAANKTLTDPLYGVQAKGAGLWREVNSTSHESGSAPEPYLRNWGSMGNAPPRIGQYIIRDKGFRDFPLALQRVSESQLSPAMRELAKAEPDGELRIDSSNGKTYKVRFLTTSSHPILFLGRQHGNVLERDSLLALRQDMIENQISPTDATYRFLRRTALMLPISWLLIFIGLWALRQIMTDRPPASTVALAAVLATLAAVSWRVHQCINLGALRRTPGWSPQWENAAGLFDAERTATWDTTIATLSWVCLALIILIPLARRLRRRRAAKSA